MQNRSLPSRLVTLLHIYLGLLLHIEQRHMIASIPGRVFAFITVRRTTRPGTSCLRMCQIFIVFVVGKNI